MNLEREAKFYTMLNDLSAGSTDHQSAITIDMKDAESVCFIAKMGAVVANAVCRIIPQESAATASTSMNDLTSPISGTTLGTTSMSQKLIASDMYRPNDRYVSCKIDRGTANAEVDAVIAVVYGSKYPPITQPTAHVQNSTWAATPTT